MYFIWRRKRKVERVCKGFEDSMEEFEIIKGYCVRSEKKIEKETMRYLRVMWYSRQRHERWRECAWVGVICVTVCMDTRKRMELLIM